MNIPRKTNFTNTCVVDKPFELLIRSLHRNHETKTITGSRDAIKRILSQGPGAFHKKSVTNALINANGKMRSPNQCTMMKASEVGR